MSLSPGKLQHMNALSNKDVIIAAAAMDQRGSLAKSLATAKGVPQKDITDEMMQEFKTAVTRILTPYASAILLDPEWGLPASKARAKNAGLLLAYENSGYDNTQPGRLPDLLPHVSVKRLKQEMGADAVKILIYYTPSDDPKVNDIKHAFVERIGAECEAYDIPFFLEFVGYDPKGGDEKGLEYAKQKPEIVTKSMAEFSKPQYKVDILKVEVPDQRANYVEGSSASQGTASCLLARRSAGSLSPRGRGRKKALHLFKRGRKQRTVYRISRYGRGKRHGLFRRPLWPRHMEGRHAYIRHKRPESAGGLPFPTKALRTFRPSIRRSHPHNRGS